MVKRARLQNGWLRLEYDCATGTFRLADLAAEAVVLNGAVSEIQWADGERWRTGEGTFAGSQERDGMLEVSHRHGSGAVLVQQFALDSDGEYALLKLIVRNEGADPLRIRSMRVIALGGEGEMRLGPDPLRLHVYTNPYYKIPASVRDLFDGFDSRIHQRGHTHGIDYLERDYTTPWQSTFDGVLYDPVGGRSAVFGFITCKRFLPLIDIRYEAADGDAIRVFALQNRCEDRVCLPGETFESETAYFYTGFSAEQGQALYAGLTGRAMGAVRLDRPMSGWCSWHYAFFDVTEDDIERNLAFAAAHPDIFASEPGGFEYMLIDYGWQRTIGSPRVHEGRFPRGMKRLADMIRDAGFKPGIWIAPFWIESGAEVIDAHPEYLLRNAAGEPLRGPHTFRSPVSYRLDLSHPGARAYVLEQLDRLINEWGYELIKMDFLEVATVLVTEEADDVRYYDGDATSIELLRSMCMEMQALADRSGRDIWLSPCGSPTLALCGVFKSNFVAEDAIIRFLPDKLHMHGGVKAFAETLALRRYMYDRLWTNNYESVILRAPRPYEEARINATSAGLAGGIAFIGDDLTVLEPERLALYAKMLPICPAQARPLDLYDSHFSGRWLLKVEAAFETWWVAALFNWDDEPKDMGLRFAEGIDGPSADRLYRVFDFWEQRDLGIVKGGASVPQIPRADCKALAIRELRPHPWLLSTDYHLTQGGTEIGALAWDEAKSALSGRFCGRRHGKAVLTFAVPPDYAIGSWICRDAFMEADPQPGCLRLRLEKLDGTDREFSLLFRNRRKEGDEHGA